MISRVYRRALLGMSAVPPVERFLRSRGMGLGVSRFVAGETLGEALAVTERLESEGLLTILDVLGEFSEDRSAAVAAAHDVMRAATALAPAPVSRALSVKPSQIGLGVDFDLALENALRIAEEAERAGIGLCLDMESHPYVDGTLELYRRLRLAGHHHVSTVLQSYLRRSRDDLEALLGQGPGVALRIVKGAYNEPPEVALPKKRSVDEQFRALVYRLWEAGGTPYIATHDERILDEAAAFARGAGLGPERYEFQLLYGVKPALQRRLAEAGHKVRIYLPFGSDWYGYFSRRLAERPANLAFVLRGLWR